LGLVGLVMRGRELLADLHQLARDDLEALVLESRDDATHEPALDGVRLEDNQRGFHGEAPGGCRRITTRPAKGAEYSAALPLFSLFHLETPARAPPGGRISEFESRRREGLNLARFVRAGLAPVPPRAGPPLPCLAPPKNPPPRGRHTATARARV